MTFVRRAAAFLFGVVLAGWVLGGPARGVGGASPAAPEPPAGGPTIRVELADGTKLEGPVRTAEFRVRTGFGVAVLDPRKIKTLAFEPVGGVTKAFAELSDKSRVSGVAETTGLELTVDGQPRQLNATEVRQIKFLQPVDPSLVAALVGLVTLTVMEVVLGVDNIIFLAILAAKLPKERQPQARRIGLLAALGTRLVLLATLSWLLGLTRPLFVLPELPFLEDPEARGVSLRDLILLVGGIFLIGKSTFEMHEKLEHSKKHGDAAPPKAGTASFASVIVQIAIIDIVFSLDSVITAVGMVDHLWVMVVAMLIAVGVMMWFATPISDFVDKYPTIKVLALSFLILIGVLLVAEGLGQHLDKGYIYFAMAFSVAVEAVNIRLRGK
jgi:predicted tellurium resistance membrane protein TerC